MNRYQRRHTLKPVGARQARIVNAPAQEEPEAEQPPAMPEPIRVACLQLAAELGFPGMNTPAGKVEPNQQGWASFVSTVDRYPLLAAMRLMVQTQLQQLQAQQQQVQRAPLLYGPGGAPLA